MSALLPSVLLFPLLCLTTTVLCDHNINVVIYNFSSFSLNCNRGEDVGLYTSILLQYRLVSAPETETPPQLWSTISVLPSNQPSQVAVEGSVELEDDVEGFQLRLVQFEYGGGTCNCWTHGDLVVTVNNDEIRLGHCATTVDSDGFFCGLSAEEGRGEITNAFYFTTTEGVPCPGDSMWTLVTDQGSPLPHFTDCETTTPRM